MSIWGIVVAAGDGRRFGGAKQHFELKGRPLWEWSRDALIEGGVDDVVVVGLVPGGVEGGVRRRDSVAAGLARVPAQAAVIMVHDAARPLASSRLVARLCAHLVAEGVDCVVPVVPVRDTVVEVEGSRVVRTLDRNRLVAVQTPQVFRAGALRKAHAEFEGDATDDASMVEAIGARVVTVSGERAAMKITYPEDMAIAESFLRKGAGP